MMQNLRSLLFRLSSLACDRPAGLSFGLLLIWIFLFAPAQLSYADDAPGSMEKAGSDLLDRAEYYFKNGEWREAEKSYLEALNSGANEARKDRIQGRLGQIEMKRGAYRAAFRYFDYVFNNSGNALLVNLARLYIAECYFHLGEVARANEIFREILHSDGEARNRWEATLYLGLVDERKSDMESAVVRLESVFSKSRIVELENSARENLDRMAGGLGKATLTGLAEKYARSFPGDVFLLRLLTIYRSEGDAAKYGAAMQSFIQNFPKHPKKALYEKVLAGLQEGRPDALQIGVVLPLTGKNSIAANKVLQGIQLAWSKLGSADKSRFELVVKDSGGNRTAVEWIERLALDPRMMGIIGPMFSKEVEESASAASEYQIPVLTPTATTTGMTARSPFLFRNAMTRENLGRFLARHAVNNLGLHRFAILYPDDAFGEELRDIFAREVSSLGGEVSVAISFENTGYDFKEAILQLGGMSDSDLKKLAKDKNYRSPAFESGLEGARLSRPVIEAVPASGDQPEGIKTSLQLSYDGLFIPAPHDKIGIIVPQLIFYNIDSVTFLGGNTWNAPDLVRSAGRYLRRAVFVDGFWGRSEEERVRDFVAGFKQLFSEEPTILSAQAYDAATMMIQGLRSGAKTRLNMHSHLSGLHDFAGVSGVTTFLPDGEADKKMFVLRVQGGEIVSGE